MGVGLNTKEQQIADLIKRRGFNPLQAKSPVYWPDMTELLSIVQCLVQDSHKMAAVIPPLFDSQLTGTPYTWFVESYPAFNEGSILTTLYQDTLEANSITTSGTSIDYHYRVDVSVPDGSTIYVKLQQGPFLTLSSQGFVVGDSFTGSSSGATGNVISVSGTTININITSGTFTTSDSITGSKSGVIANIITVTPLSVWLLGTITPTANSHNFIDGKVFITNTASKTAESELFNDYDGNTTTFSHILAITGLNTSFPIKILLQGISTVSSHIKAVYGRGLLYPIIPFLPL